MKKFKNDIAIASKHASPSNGSSNVPNKGNNMIAIAMYGTLVLPKYSQLIDLMRCAETSFLKLSLPSVWHLIISLSFKFLNTTALNKL